MTEEWKPVPGFEKLYEVSSLGRVASVRTVANTYAGRIVKPKPDRYGYLHVRLSRDSRVTKHRVHRLIAAAFYGPCPEGHEVNHKDHCRTNNAASNLEYVTRQGNSQHKVKAGRQVRGERSRQAKLTETDIVAIRAARGVSQVWLATKYSVSRRTIQLILAGKMWTHV